MTMTRRRSLKTGLGLVTCSLASGGVLIAASRPAGPERHLYVWAGHQGAKAPEFLALVNFDEASPDYGKLIKTVHVPNPGDKGNEPHHVGLSADGRILAGGGLLSVLKGQKEVFFFDVSDPARPRFLSAADPPQSAITDEFYALENGGFLVTMMGSAQGHHPGRVAEFDRKGQLVAEHPAEPPQNGFNPHGISVRPEINLMVTSDFVCPSTTLHAVPGDLALRGSVSGTSGRARSCARSTCPVQAAPSTCASSRATGPCAATPREWLTTSSTSSTRRRGRRGRSSTSQPSPRAAGRSS